MKCLVSITSPLPLWKRCKRSEEVTEELANKTERLSHTSPTDNNTIKIDSFKAVDFYCIFHRLILPPLQQVLHIPQREQKPLPYMASCKRDK